MASWRSSRHSSAPICSRPAWPRDRAVAIMMPNILQYPVAMMGALRAGYTIVNINPLYTPRELEHQLKGFGRRSDRHPSKTSPTTLQPVVSKTKVKHVVVAAMGDFDGQREGVSSSIWWCAGVRKMVPSWNLPGHMKFNAALAKGKAGILQKVALTPDDYAFPAIYGRNDRCFEGCRADAWQRAVQRRPRMKCGCRRCSTARSGPTSWSTSARCRSTTFSALTVNAMMGMQQGAHNILIPNPREIPGFVKRASEPQVPHLPRPQHAVQRAAQQ